MPKALQLNIAEPCHENWQNMTLQQQGRFCGSCQKTVVDFTMMSDQEVLNYFLKTEHNVCGRFADDQLNKDLIITRKKKRFTWMYVWNILMATFLVAKADAQVEPKPKAPVETIEREPQIMGKVAYVPPTGKPVVIKGQVVDETNSLPVVGASVRIMGAGGGCMADSTGKFSLKVENKASVILEFSAIGYETQTLQVDDLSQPVDVVLKQSVSNLKEVSVIVYEKTIKLGGAMGIVRYTRAEKLKRNINDWVPAALKNDVKVYPNPVVRGNSLTVNLSLKQAGAYRLEVLNAAGQIMQIQPLLMQTKAQVINLHTQVSWSAGIYWLRISSPKMKNVYQSKILIK
ncbi:MAG TPA: carboxypeptidase-like regulatory domain-containing protein [Niastella sp.]|nr:carboxypeptidase-like regulatory domain-containing protein [Niastella sp.]